MFSGGLYICPELLRVRHEGVKFSLVGHVAHAYIAPLSVI